MKKPLLVLLSCALLLGACKNNSNQQTAGSSDNPFLSEFKAPLQAIPFDKIKNEHFKPAIEEGIKIQKQEIEAIINNTEAPTFENTILAIDNSGSVLRIANYTLDNLTSAFTNDTLQKISQEISPLTTAQRDEIYMNEKLFAKVKTIFDNKANLKLSSEQTQLLDKIYKRFIRGGVNLPADQRKRFSEINKELALLELKFSDNILSETNGYKLVVENKDDLIGMPEDAIASAAEKAKKAGMEGKYVFTLNKPSILPFLQYCSKRELREKIYKAYINRGNNGNEFDNKANIEKITALRYEKVKMLGFDDFASYALDNVMAKKPENVLNLLNKIWKPALVVANNEIKDLQAMIDKEGGKFKLEAWDWSYYAEKVKKAKYDLDEDEARPYFKLENVRDGVFQVSTKLFGVTFEKRTDIPVYNPDVEVYEVKDADGSTLSVLYCDYYAGPQKRGGAWMVNFRDQWMENGKRVNPIISINFNYAKPSGDKPTLLNFDEVSTFYHEFGHALHGFLSKCQYRGTSGTEVALDFVELPSQIMENWAFEPEVLKMYAKHYKTNEVIPDALVEKMKKAGQFNQGFTTVEFVSAALLDMNYHLVNEKLNTNVIDFEKNYLSSINMPKEITVRYRSTYFNHIFGGGYSAGYYSYIWAEILDADAFDAFKEKGIFDEATAKSFKENILSKGSSDEPMKLYKNFRGADPKEEALLKRRGLI